MESENLTVIVPVGNVVAHADNIIQIAQAIEESKSQGIIVFDDIDILSSEKLARKLKKFERCQILFYEGRNPGGARNLGKRSAKTEWVQFCDSDDKIHLDAKIYGNLERTGLGLDAVVCSYLILDQSKKTFVRKKSKYLLEVAWNPGIWRWIFRRQSISQIDFLESRIGEDVYFLAKFLSMNPRITLSREHVYTYQVGIDNSLTKKMSISELRKTMYETRKIKSSEADFKFKIAIGIIQSRMKLTILKHSIKYWVKRKDFVEILRNIFKKSK
jgi:glycosyltransferase involved in cell wall biosynthesis